MNSFFSELVARTDDALCSFGEVPAVAVAAREGLSPERYQRFLLELHHLATHFGPICGLAATRMRPAQQPLRTYLNRIFNAASCARQLVARDLQVLGLADVDVRLHVPGPCTVALVGYNYHGADRGHPCTALGMVYAALLVAGLYGSIFAAAMLERLSAEQESQMKFVRSYSLFDARDVEELRGLLNLLDDAPAQRAALASVRVNLHQFAQIVAQL